MKRVETSLPGVWIVEPKIFGDARGYFFESYQREKFAQLGITADFVQDNRSFSRQGVVRGLHFQLRYPQAKLCSALQGEVFDVAVDVRQGSPTFGKWIGVTLSAENKKQIYIPQGFAHGFAVLSETAEFMYKCSDYYHPEDDGGVAWNDPEIGIDWPIESPILSQKDALFLPLAQTLAEKLPIFHSAFSP
ncbi:MAG: dTDP-4-dehydrorhamnose 3,5-epimerase [Anaerolineae bacterium]|nr:dTDP-4-dehydrorhamnose 3,5-epimerase [Gloeobacterales cyanobacterium ES-bin-313]